MGVQHRICFSSKETNLKGLIIFVDDKIMESKKSKCICNKSAGNHTIRIEQYKMIKSKYYWIIYPICLVVSLISGDSDFDGKTPFYIVYEAEIYLDKDIEINIELYDVNRNIKKSKQGFSYKIDVDFTKETEVKVIKNEFTATPQERRRWFLYFVTLWTISFMFLIGVFTLIAINSFKTGFGVSGTILFGFLSCLSMLGWILFIRRYYKWSNGEY